MTLGHEGNFAVFLASGFFPTVISTFCREAVEKVHETSTEKETGRLRIQAKTWAA